MEYALQNTNYPYTPSNLLSILYKSEIIEKIQAKYMERIKYIIK